MTDHSNDLENNKTSLVITLYAPIKPTPNWMNIPLHKVHLKEQLYIILGQQAQEMILVSRKQAIT